MYEDSFCRLHPEASETHELGASLPGPEKIFVVVVVASQDLVVIRIVEIVK